MATRSVTLSERRVTGEGQAWIAQWTGLLNGDDGEPIELNQFADMSVQVTGTFGTGGSVAVEGSNDGTNYAALRDPSSTTIALTAASIKQILEKTRFLRPHVTAGDGATTLVVTIYMGSARQ